MADGGCGDRIVREEKISNRTGGKIFGNGGTKVKRIALINDLSGLGKCSLTAAIPVISAMGLQACPLPTAVLSAQTGFEGYYFDDYTDRMNRITDHWDKMEMSFDGIASGYLGNARQIENLQYFLEKFHGTNTIFLADPVLGDNGKLIKSFSQELLQTMRELTKKADVITPNLTELCLLVGADYAALFAHSADEDYLSRIAETARKLFGGAERLQTIIVTGIVTRKAEGEYIGNLVVTALDDRYSYFETAYNGRSFSGTGDLFASVVIGGLVKGQSAANTVQLAMKFLQPAIEDAMRENVPRDHGVCFEKYLKFLI